MENIKERLNESLPRPLDELVEYFDKVPIASASMAQVHRARLLGGQEVVLKILRPHIRKEIAVDIAILKNMVEIALNYFPDIIIYQPAELIRMFETSIEDELDFTIEAKNLLYFQKMFEGNTEIYIPKLYPEICTKEVLCMEYIEGYKITDLESLEKFKITGKEVAKRGIGLYFEQVFHHGFFHADPHPGNIFVKDNGQIVFIDYGMMGTVTDEDQLLFAKMLLAIYEEDVLGLKKAILKFSTGIDKDKETELEIDILTFFRNYSDVNIENIDGNEMMKALNSLFFDYKIRIPAGLLLLLKALIIIEGVGLKIDPEYNIIDNIGPFTEELVNKKYNVQSFKKDALRSLEEVEFFVKEFPSDAREIINKIKKGKLHIEIEHKGLEIITHNLDVNVNRISFTFIVVAILLTSGIIIHAGIPPRINDISILGIIGLVISFLLAIRLLYAILRKGKI